ncbi:hypothetical protein J2D73_19990 [Acetobacter sacchari]|uniref:Phage protein n=1 Tax=Acetobacter sacchari TaxID=2661687 RepID=A0ABS3M1J4_9PROT|nr:zinc-finger-containing protein [Acetobacter sacchari]MBO1362066.1 hypothetical protein [Acetobacter sacchari]
MEVICAYCGNDAKKIENSSSIYGGRDYGPAWVCEPCGAWVGCHPDGKPLGRLANKELRMAKQRAHAVFDPLWKRKMERDGLRKGHARAKAYKWLAGCLGIERSDCHIGMFDTAMCQRVVDCCAPYVRGGV